MHQQRSSTRPTYRVLPILNKIIKIRKLKKKQYNIAKSIEFYNFIKKTSSMFVKCTVVLGIIYNISALYFSRLRSVISFLKS